MGGWSGRVCMFTSHAAQSSSIHTYTSFSYKQEADRVATIAKLRTLADPAAVGTIQSITQGRRPRRSQRQQQQEQGPAVEFYKTRIAQPKQNGKRGKGKRGKGWGGAGAEMRCSGAVVEHVCVALPQELWIELMRCWGPEHFGR